MKRSIAFISVLLILAGCVTQNSRQWTAESDPLNKIIGPWYPTFFAIEGENFTVLRCEQYGKQAVVTIPPPTESAISFNINCDNGSEYVFKLKGDEQKNTYFVTVKYKEWMSINELAVTYVEGNGWKGVSNQLLNGRTVSTTVTIAPIEGRQWYGWMIAVQPTAYFRKDDTPYLRVDLIRRK